MNRSRRPLSEPAFQREIWRRWESNPRKVPADPRLRSLETERERRRQEVLRALKEAGATGTVSLTARELADRLGYGQDKWALRSLNARLVSARNRGLVRTSYAGGVAHYSLTEAA